MRPSRFSQEQIVGILDEARAGRRLVELCRDHGISRETYYRWRTKFGGPRPQEASRLRHLEDENRRLKQMVAELTLDNQTLKGLAARKR